MYYNSNWHMANVLKIVNIIVYKSFSDFYSLSLLVYIVVLKRGTFCSREEILQYLETFLGFTTWLETGRCCHLVGRGQKCCLNILLYPGQTPIKRIMQPKMLIVPRLRHSGLVQCLKLNRHDQ